jgi:hypothetical protein
MTGAECHARALHRRAKWAWPLLLRLRRAPILREATSATQVLEGLARGRHLSAAAQGTTASHTFSVVRKKSGEVKRICAPEGKTGSEGGGCQNSTW